MSGIAERESSEAAASGSASLRVASRGIHTVRDVNNLSLGIALDALTGHVGTKNGNLAIRAVGTVMRGIELGEKVGQRKDVVEGRIEAPSASSEAELLRAEEAELTARLEALRERRGG